MTNQESDEQITLYSPEFNQRDEDISLNVVTHELLQTSNLKEQQKLFRIYDNKYLNINLKDTSSMSSFTVHLTLLDAKPAHKWFIAYRYLFFSCIFFLLAWITYYLIKLQTPYFTGLYTYAAVALLIAVAAILAVYAFKQSRNVLIFFSQHGQIPIVEFLYQIPDKAGFRRFIAELVNCIQNSKTKIYYTDSQTLAVELSEHRRLRDEGVISNEQYEKAKARIFNSHSADSSPAKKVHR